MLLKQKLSSRKRYFRDRSCEAVSQLFYKGELAELLVAVLVVFAVFTGYYAWSLPTPHRAEVASFLLRHLRPT
jgi:hypothetical protein